MITYFAFLFIFQLGYCLNNITDQQNQFDEDDYVRRYARSIRAEYGDQLKPSYEQDLTNFISRRKRSHGSTCDLSKQIGTNSECTCLGGPRKTMVELPMINGDMSGNTLQMPRCLSIERCSSSCSSPKYKCVPTEMEMVQVPVSILSPTKNMKDECKLLDVVKHTKCDCVCVKTESECDDFQVFNADTCKCVCKMKPHMCGSEKKFNFRKCQCQCLRVKECSNGFNFSDETCDCEESRSENIDDYYN